MIGATKDKIIGAVITFQSCKTLSHSTDKPSNSWVMVLYGMQAEEVCLVVVISHRQMGLVHLDS